MPTERRHKPRAGPRAQPDTDLSAALTRVGRDLIQSLDRPVLLERLSRATTEALRCDCSHTLLWHADSRAFTMVSSYGDSPEQTESLRLLSIPIELMSTLTARLDQRDVVSLVLTEPQDVVQPALPLQYGITALLCAGLRRGDDLIGIHTAGYRGGPAFTTHQARLMQGVAQLASLALAHTQALEELAGANRLKYDFVATMSHELRTPLNVIMGYSDLLIDGAFGPLATAQLDAVRRMAGSGKQLFELIETTLDLGRIEAGRASLNLRDVRPAEVLRAIEAETREIQGKPGVHVAWELPARLPVLSTDALKLKVVIKNLLGNALKFTDAGRVTVSARRIAAGVEIAVADTGIGIPHELHSVIFEPFRQADSSTTRRYGGVGLGLYIVRRLVDMLGGTLTMESTVGRGSTFRVWLPGKRR